MLKVPSAVAFGSISLQLKLRPSGTEYYVSRTFLSRNFKISVISFRATYISTVVESISSLKGTQASDSGVYILIQIKSIFGCGLRKLFRNLSIRRRSPFLRWREAIGVLDPILLELLSFATKFPLSGSCGEYSNVRLPRPSPTAKA